MSSVLQLSSKQVPTILKARNACCGKSVDELALHGLSCVKNAGHLPRHSAINSILKSRAVEPVLKFQAPASAPAI